MSKIEYTYLDDLILDLINVIGTKKYKGCIIEKKDGFYSWQNRIKSISLEEVKKYIDEALLSLNKSIKK